MAGIEQISTSEIPTLGISKLFFDKTPADEMVSISGVSDEKLNNFIKAKVTVSLNYENIYADTVVSKYLKFKVILCSTQSELEYYKSNLTKLDNFSDKNIKSFSFADLRIVASTVKNTQTFIFVPDYIIRKNNSLSIVNDLNYNFLIYSHYDLNALEKDFNFSIKNTLNFETLFYSEPTVVNINTLFKNGKVILKDLYSLITNQLNDDVLFHKSNSKIKSVKKNKNYISPLIATKDILGGQDILRYGFFFDKDRFILENTIFPELYRTPLWMDVIRNSKNINIELVRYKSVDIENNGNHYNEFVTAPSISDKAKDVFPDLDFYTGIDKSVYSKRSGMYGYQVKLDFTDGAFAIILEQIKKIKDNIKKLKEYKTIVSQPTISTGYLKDLNPYIDIGMEEVEASKYKQGNYSYEEDRVLESALPEYNRLLSTFSKDFINAYTCLYETNNSVTNALLTSMVLPSIASLSTIETVIQFHYQLLNEFKNILHRKLNYIDESLLLNEQNTGFGQAPVSLQLMSAFRKFDAQIDTEEYTNFGLRYHTTTAYNDSGIVSVSELNELQVNNIYGNKKYIGPKFIYIKDRYPLPLALTGIPQYYFDTIHSFLDTYSTKTFDALLNKYNYIDAPIDITSIQAAETPLSSRILLNKNKISFDGIQGLPGLDQSSKNISLDRGLHTLANLIEEWSNRLVVNNQVNTEINREYQNFDKRNIGSILNLFENVEAFSCFKVIYDGVKEVSELTFNLVNSSEDDKKQYIVPSQIKLLNDFIFKPYDAISNKENLLFSDNNNIKYIKENNISYPNAKVTKLCFLHNYSNPEAYLMHIRFEKVPVFNRWFFLNDDASVVGPTELLSAKPDIFSSIPAPQINTPVVPIIPISVSTPTSPIVTKITSPTVSQLLPQPTIVPQPLPTPVINSQITKQQNNTIIGNIALNETNLANNGLQVTPGTIAGPVGATTTPINTPTLANTLTIKPNTLKIN